MIPVLNTSPIFDPEGEPLRILQASGCTLVANTYQSGRTEAELIALLEEGRPRGIIAGLDPFTEPVLAAGARLGLRVVARTGVGYDTVDVDAATTHTIVVCTTIGSNHHAVADLTFALLLAVARRIPYHDRLVREGQVWTRHRGTEVWNKTIGIVGLGAIGRAVARRAAGFDMRVLAYDTQQDAAYADAHGITYVALDDLLGQADIITLHVSLNPTSRQMIGARELRLVKPSAVLINTSRGGAIDEAALYQALTGGRLAGAGLDVFEQEPPSGSPLLGLDNVVLTPHVAGITEESVARAAVIAAQNVANVLTGRRPLSAVNPQVVERLGLAPIPPA